MRRVSAVEVRKRTEAAMYRNLKIVERLKGATNPQEIEMRQRAQGAADAFQSVNQALWGDSVTLKIDAGL